MEPLLRLTRTYGCHIHMLHHSNKTGGDHGFDASGSTGLTGSVDTHLNILHGIEGKRMIAARGRDDVHMEKTHLEIDPNGWVHLGESKRDQDVRDLGAEILEIIRENPSIKGRVLRDKMKCDASKFSRALNQLTMDRDIERMGSGSGNSPFAYRICLDTPKPDPTDDQG